MSTETNFINPTDPDFDQTQTFGMPSQKKRRRRVSWLIGIVILVLVTLGAMTAIGAGRFFSGVGETEEAFARAQEAAVALDFDSALVALDDAEDGLAKARSGLKFLKWTVVLPWVGDQVQALSAVFDAGSESVQALKQAVEIASEVYAVVYEAEEILSALDIDASMAFRDLPDETRIRLLQTLGNSLPQLKAAQVSLRLAGEDLNKLDDLNVHPALLNAVDPFRQAIPTLIEGVDLLVPFAASINEIAGVGEDRQWLLLFLNNTEMRPGGGFIGVYGLLTVRDGELVDLTIQDSYAIDQLVEDSYSYTQLPPDALATYVGEDKWYFRDSNWSPDFAASSQFAVDVLRQELSAAGYPVPEIHGVLGLTPTFAASIMEITGPATVRGITFDSDNLAELLEYEVEYGFVEREIPFSERKVIIDVLAESVIGDLLDLEVSQLGTLFGKVTEGFTSKYLGLYSLDEDTQSAFVDAGWAQTIDIEDTDDFLMVVDANMSALKTDPVVDRQIDYSIVEDDDGYIATVSVTYINTGSFTLFTTRYRTFTRVYVPLGSELISHSGSLRNDKLSNPLLEEGEVTVAEEDGMTSFGAFTSIEPGEERTLSFTYRLPESIEEAVKDRLYQLTVFKQVGAADHVLTLDLGFGKKVKVADPAEDESEWGDKSYRLEDVLDEDTVFTVEF
ncbi:MAG: DUF4012 domain-containing protein [bacterium]